MPNRRPDPARERLWRKRLARWKVCYPGRRCADPSSGE